MTLTFAKTYEMAVSPPPAMSWKDYSQIVEHEWQKLLASPHGEVEANIQTFLETHPCMVPGSQSMSGTSGHAPILASLLKQPRLSGFSQKIPDFMWLATDSMTNYAVFVEIETPQKKWFTGKGVPTADFTQARNQLSEWHDWITDPINQQSFLNHYRFHSPFRSFRPEYVLIYGRRSEFDQNPFLARKRARLQNANETHMTFDRLHPISNAKEYMTVERTFDGYRAVSVPACIELGPGLADCRSAIREKEEAVDRSPFMTAERKQFLKSRFAYWDAWNREGIISTGDWE